METFTFLFTDIEGSTALLRRLGESSYADVLAAHHALIRPALAAHDGTEVDTQGDAFFAVFSSPRGCVLAAVQIQRAMAAQAWPGGEHVRVRIGIHTGEAEQTPAGLVGLDVHRAARLAAVASGGQVVLSETTAALVRDSLPPGMTLSDLGVHRLGPACRGRPSRQDSLAGIRVQLGEREADRAFAQGSTLSAEEAFRYVFGAPAPAGSTGSGVGDPGPDLVGHGGQARDQARDQAGVLRPPGQ